MLETRVYGKLLPSHRDIRPILDDIRAKYEIPEITSDGGGLTDPAHFVAATNTGWALFSSDSTWYGIWLGPGTYTIVD